MAMKGYCGEAYDAAENFLGTVWKATDGYVIRKPTGRSIGPVVFDGRVFPAKAFRKLSSLDCGYTVVRRYELSV